MYFLFIDPIRPHQYIAVMPDSKTKLPWQRTGRLVDLQGKVRSTICNSFQSTINSRSTFLIEMEKLIPAGSRVST